MGSSRWGRCVLGLVMMVGVMPPRGASADAATLVPANPDARPGQSIVLTGDYCGTGSTITTMTESTKGEHPKSPIMTFPVDLSSVGIVQTAVGFSLTFGPTTDPFGNPLPSARTSIWFDVTCSDGVTAESSKVLVWPPVGELWFHTLSGTFGGAPGTTVSIDVSSLDCVDGSTASLQIVNGSVTIGQASTTVQGRQLHFELTIALTATAGDSVMYVTCDKIGGGNVTDSRPFTVSTAPPPAGPPGNMPATGGSPVLPWLALALVVAGGGGVRLGRRRA